MPPPVVQNHPMPLAEFIAEVMDLLAQDRPPDEICAERVKFLRGAEVRGEFGQLFGLLNQAR